MKYFGPWQDLAKAELHEGSFVITLPHVDFVIEDSRSSDTFDNISVGNSSNPETLHFSDLFKARSPAFVNKNVVGNQYYLVSSRKELRGLNRLLKLLDNKIIIIGDDDFERVEEKIDLAVKLINDLIDANEQDRDDEIYYLALGVLYFINAEYKECQKAFIKCEQAGNRRPSHFIFELSRYVLTVLSNVYDFHSNMAIKTKSHKIAYINSLSVSGQKGTGVQGMMVKNLEEVSDYWRHGNTEYIGLNHFASKRHTNVENLMIDVANFRPDSVIYFGHGIRETKAIRFIFTDVNGIEGKVDVRLQDFIGIVDKLFSNTEIEVLLLDCFSNPDELKGSRQAIIANEEVVHQTFVTSLAYSYYRNRPVLHDVKQLFVLSAMFTVMFTAEGMNMFMKIGNETYP